MCLVSVAAVILSVFFYSDLDTLEDANLVTAIKLYRPGFSIWLFLLFIGVNIWGWRTAGVNHVLIFEIDPREHLRIGFFYKIRFYKNKISMKILVRVSAAMLEFF